MMARLLCIVLLCWSIPSVAEPLQGRIISVGSDTMASIVTDWAQAFRQQHPAVTIEIQATGSRSAPPALEQGAATLGVMSRAMTAGEKARFARMTGYPPTEFVVGVDKIAMIVHPDNPIERITTVEIDGVFSSTHFCGGGPIKTWDHFMPGGAYQRAEIDPIARTATSGTHGFFTTNALCGGDLRAKVARIPGSQAIVQSVARNPLAIGYASIGLVNHSVRVLPVAQGNRYYMPQEADYPLTRSLYVYFNADASKGLDPIECAFMRYVLSPKGQGLLSRHGLLPLSAGALISQQQALGRLHCA